MQNSRRRSYTENSEQMAHSKGMNNRIKRSNSSLLDHQLLRLQICQKQELIKQLFNKNQKQLSHFFVKEYSPQTHSRINLKKVLNERTEQIRLIKNSNKIYFGGMDHNHKRVGDGILIDEKGKIYEGTFIENAKQGYGVQIYPNGNVYIGHFENNKKHGEGVFFWYTLSPPLKDQASYVQFYSGAWWGGLPDGKGSHQKNTGDIYDGEFKNGLKHGSGQEYFFNGDNYKGEYVNGLPEGFGLYIWKDKSRYQGDFKQGLRNGYGIWISGNLKEQYKGQYILDKKFGYGQYAWQNMLYLYKGNFQNDLRNGFGELYHRGELQYKGEWIHGKIEEKQSQHNHHHQSHVKLNNPQKSFMRTPKSEKLPSLSRLRPPASAIVKRIKTNDFIKEKSLSRSRSPTQLKLRSKSPTYSNQGDTLHKISKNFTLNKQNKLNNPLRRVRSVEKTLKKRPVSYSHRKLIAGCEPHYELLVKKCIKKNCGCNVSIPLKTKNGSKKLGKKRQVTHFKTQDFCF